MNDNPEEQTEPIVTLEDLLAMITDDNIHPEIDFGPDVGKEIIEPYDDSQ